MTRSSGTLGREIATRAATRPGPCSSVKHPVRCFGLRWVVLAALVPMPWGGRPWALPFLTALTWPAGKGHAPGPQVVDRLGAVDGSYGPPLGADRMSSSSTAASRRWPWPRSAAGTGSRWWSPEGQRGGARRPAVPPPGSAGQPKLGRRQLAPRRRALRGPTPRGVEVAWYGGRPKTVRVIAAAGLWRAPGRAGGDRLRRGRDPEGRHRDAAYFSTDEAMPPARMLGYAVQPVEPGGDLRGGEAHLGIETQRQWSDRACSDGIGPLRAVLGGLPAGDAAGTPPPHWSEGLGLVREGGPHVLSCLASARREIWLGRINRGSGRRGRPPGKDAGRSGKP